MLKTNQNVMKKFIIDEEVITCPFGHVHDYSDNANQRIYSSSPTPRQNIIWLSDGQDKKFMEKIDIGDIVVTPFKDQNKVLISEITSEPYRKNFTDMFVVFKDNNYHCITKDISLYEDDKFHIETFKPVVRDINILTIAEPDFSMRCFGQKTIRTVRENTTVHNWVLDILNE